MPDSAKGQSKIALEAVKNDPKANYIPTCLAMCIGLFGWGDENRPLANYEDQDSVWRHLPKAAVPKVPDLKTEMKRRAAAVGLKKLRKNTAPKAECVNWLKQNPVKCGADIAYLLEEEGKIYENLLEVEKEHSLQSRARLLTANWSTKEPHCRLIGCMVHDDAVQALRHHDSVMERDELDARNSDKRPETFFEVVARLYNNNKLTIHIPSLPEVHSEFADQMNLKFEDMPGGEISVEDVKKRITELRAKTTQVRNIRPNHVFSIASSPI